MPVAYAALRDSVVDAGLLDRARAYYTWRTTISFLILGVGLTEASVAAPLAALLIAFGSVQIGLIGHDAGHLAVCATRRANAVLGSVCWSLVLGVSFCYWTDRHNRHHASPNDSGLDPDVQWDSAAALTPFLAFTFRLESWQYALGQLRGRQRLTELTLLALSALGWLAPALALGLPWLATVLVSQLLAGLYLAAIVAPNHIGMPVWPPGAALPFLERQLLSSRNVSPSPLIDFVFGGLNYQIEHHLFPTMPRAHFSSAQALVKTFCAERALPYTELGVRAVYRAVLAELPGWVAISADANAGALGQVDGELVGGRPAHFATRPDAPGCGRGPVAEWHS